MWSRGFLNQLRFFRCLSSSRSNRVVYPVSAKPFSFTLCSYWLLVRRKVIPATTSRRHIFFPHIVVGCPQPGTQRVPIPFQILCGLRQLIELCRFLGIVLRLVLFSRKPKNDNFGTKYWKIFCVTGRATHIYPSCFQMPRLEPVYCFLSKQTLPETGEDLWHYPSRLLIVLREASYLNSNA